VLAELAGDDDSDVRRAVAANPNTLEMAANPDTPIDVLEALASLRNYDICSALADNENFDTFPEDLLMDITDTLYRSPGWYTR